ncbi:MAG TPA: hypothetical protein VIL48_07285 [Acidimicrobiales bacterium]
MDRRSFLLLTGAALTTPAHEWLIARGAEDTGRRTGRVVTAAYADHLDTITDRLRRMDDRVGGGSLAEKVRVQIDQVTSLMDNGSYTDSIGRRLHATTAELLRLAGWLNFDAGRHREARSYFVAALRAAHIAGDRELAANVLGFMSCQAKDLGNLDDAINLADTAISGYRGANPRVSAILHMRAAQAYANTGDVTETRRSIDAAYSAFRDADEDAGPAWSYWLDEAQINEQIGYCYLRLNDWSRATSHMRKAVQLHREPYSREGALRLALLADVYAQQGEPEQACRLGHQALDTLAVEVNSARCVGHVRQVSEHLRPYRRTAVAQDFDERLRQLAAA